jgi:hypothetical protein
MSNSGPPSTPSKKSSIEAYCRCVTETAIHVSTERPSTVFFPGKQVGPPSTPAPN